MTLSLTGRPTKRTPEVVDRILAALAEGNTRRSSCALAGISEDSFQRWQNPEHESYDAAFAADVKHAEHLAEAERIARIRSAGMGGAVTKRYTTKNGAEVIEYAAPQWQADAWYLERKYRDTWARPTEQTIGVQITIPIQVNITTNAADAI